MGVWQFSQAIFNGPCGFWEAAIEPPTVPAAVTRTVTTQKGTAHKSPYHHFFVDLQDKRILFQSFRDDEHAESALLNGLLGRRGGPGDIVVRSILRFGSR